MSRVTSKLQVTIPKAIAEKHHLKPGNDVFFESAGDIVRMIPAGRDERKKNLPEVLISFDAATRRQQQRDDRVSVALGAAGKDRGWKREELYERGVPG